MAMKVLMLVSHLYGQGSYLYMISDTGTHGGGGGGGGRRPLINFRKAIA